MIDEAGLSRFPDLSKLLDLYNAQTATVNILWNIFIAVNLGILGLLYKDSQLGKDWRIKVGFTLGFLFFAWGNQMAILRSQKILFAISEFLRGLEMDDSSRARSILLAHSAIPPRKIRNGHLIFTLMVAALIWVTDIQRLLASLKVG